MMQGPAYQMKCSAKRTVWSYIAELAYNFTNRAEKVQNPLIEFILKIKQSCYKPGVAQSVPGN